MAKGYEAMGPPLALMHKGGGGGTGPALKANDTFGDQCVKYKN